MSDYALSGDNSLINRSLKIHYCQKVFIVSLSDNSRFNVLEICLSDSKSQFMEVGRTVNLHQQRTMLSFIKEAKEIILDFLQRTVIAL